MSEQGVRVVRAYARGSSSVPRKKEKTLNFQKQYDGHRYLAVVMDIMSKRSFQRIFYPHFCSKTPSPLLTPSNIECFLLVCSFRHRGLVRV